MEEAPTRKRDASDRSPEETLEAKRLKAADLILLDMLDEIESSDRSPADPPAGDLDTVLRSFEEEICVASTSAVSYPDDVVQPDLSYLLEASDDELGLPPAAQSSSNDGESPPPQIWRLDVDFSCFDTLDLGSVIGGECTAEFPDNSWRPESLPAV